MELLPSAANGENEFITLENNKVELKISLKEEGLFSKTKRLQNF